MTRTQLSAGRGAALLERETGASAAVAPAATQPRVVPLLAHEIRAPLAAIKSYAEILLTCPPADAADRREFLKAIGEESERIRRLLDDVSEIDRLESAMLPFIPAPCDLGELVERAILQVHPLTATRRIDLEAERASEPPLVPGEPQRLLRAITALVENAVKFTPIGGRARVRIVTWDGEETVAVEVADEGMGVPPAAAPRLFEKFYQASVPPDSLSPRGSGLGLALVRLVAARHGGRVAYQPRAKGSVFTLTLPRL